MLQNRSACYRLGGSLLLPLFVLVFVAASPSSAQLGGIPGMNAGHSPAIGFDSGLKDATVDSVDLYALKRAYRKGVKFLKQGKCRKAKEQFNFVLNSLPEHAPVLYLTGTADRCEKNFKSAVRHYSEAIEHDESMYPAYKSLGISYLALGELGEASKLLGRLEIMRMDCEESCPEELVSDHTDLEGTIELVRAR